MEQPNSIPDKGDCYQASLENALELQELKRQIESGQLNEPAARTIYEKMSLKEDILIRHGWANTVNGRGHHAWIEVGDYVIETQGGQRNLDHKDAYYKAFAVYPNETFTVDEAEHLRKEQGKFGAWRGRGNDRPTQVIDETEVAAGQPATRSESKYPPA
jgi:hypothetical protein